MDDLLDIIRTLQTEQKGDQIRLGIIGKTIKSGEKIFQSDFHYLQRLYKKPIHTDLVIEYETIKYVSHQSRNYFKILSIMFLTISVIGLVSLRFLYPVEFSDILDGFIVQLKTNLSPILCKYADLCNLIS